MEVCVNVDTPRLRQFAVRSDQAVRIWSAEDESHAREQHRDAHPEEFVIEIWWERFAVGSTVALTECPTLGEDGPISGLWTILTSIPGDVSTRGRGTYVLTCRDQFPCLRGEQTCHRLPLELRCANCRVATEQEVDESDLWEQVDPKGYGMKLVEERDQLIQDELAEDGEEVVF